MQALLNPPALPVFDGLSPEHLESTVDELLVQARAEITRLAGQPSPTWANFAQPLEDLDDRLSAAWSPISQINAVMNSEAWRNAYNACLPKWSAYSTEVGQNETLCATWKALRHSLEFANLSVAQQQTIDNVLRDFTLSGIGLPADKKTRYAEISERLSVLSAQFADHVLDATQAWSLQLADASRLTGVPDSNLALMASLAQSAQPETKEPGYRLTLDMPVYLAIMTYAEDRALREEMYTAYATRASDQGPHAEQFNNAPLITELLGLRQEMAELLGLPHYAALSLVPKMAESAEQVEQFLLDLVTKSRASAERDMADLREYAELTLGLSDLQPWDVSFVSERLKQARFAVSQEQLKPYFPAPKVIQGLFAICEQLFGVRVRPAPELASYHADVSTYALEEHGEVRAYFYLDLYARANKRGGAWMANARSRRLLSNGQLQKPIAFLTGNFNPPVDGRPALLTHNEVTTLFHEFGHGLHHMLTDITVSSVSGIHGVAWDAVELPSQFLENWCWSPEGLALMSGHVDTGESLPSEMLARLLAAKNFQSGLMTLRQLEFALFDLRIHAGLGMDFEQAMAVLGQVRALTSVLPVPAWNRFPCSFTHIFAGGYAAGYYSYKWAEVLSADAFSAFEASGVMSAETGRRFRASILAQGGSRPAADLFREFMGRDPSPQALLRHSGLLPEAA